MDKIARKEKKIKEVQFILNDYRTCFTTVQIIVHISVTHSASEDTHGYFMASNKQPVLHKNMDLLAGSFSAPEDFLDSFERQKNGTRYQCLGKRIATNCFHEVYHRYAFPSDDSI